MISETYYQMIWKKVYVLRERESKCGRMLTNGEI